MELHIRTRVHATAQGQRNMPIRLTTSTTSLMLESLINPLYLPYIAYLQYVPTHAVPLPHLRQTKHTIKGTRKIDCVKCLSEKMLRKDAISAFLRHFSNPFPRNSVASRQFLQCLRLSLASSRACQKIQLSTTCGLRFRCVLCLEDEGPKKSGVWTLEPIHGTAITTDLMILTLDSR